MMKAIAILQHFTERNAHFVQQGITVLCVIIVRDIKDNC